MTIAARRLCSRWKFNYVMNEADDLNITEESVKVTIIEL